MIYLFLTLFVLMLIGTPIWVSLGLSSLIYVLMEGLPPVLVLHNMVNGIDSFPLIAVPFFILSGSLMNHIGITDKIFAFAKAQVGWLHGGLGYVNIGSSVVFAGMSGAAVADAGGLGSVEIKAMRDSGYDADFAVGITGASSVIGPIIPPSLPLVIYGVLASASIGQLFIAGVVPGLIMSFALAVMVYIYAKRRGYGQDDVFSWTRLYQTFKESFLSLLTPVLIVGGIVGGIFTPTEAAIASVFYVLVLGTLVYKTLSFQKFIQVTQETIETTSAILLIVASSTVFAWILTANQVAIVFPEMILSITTNQTFILLMMLALILVIGCFMETIASITILVPVLLPMAKQLGMDPVHFGIVLVLGLMIGLLTPPVGMVLYVLSKVSDVPFEKCVKATLPFLIPLLTTLLLVTFIPELSTWLPMLFNF